MATRQIASRERAYRCRQDGCPNYFSEVIGGDNAFGKNAIKSSDCIPCNFAAQMVDNGQTPEMVEAIPELLEGFIDLLEKTGWTWEHVKESFTRRPKIM